MKNEWGEQSNRFRLNIIWAIVIPLLIIAISFPIINYALNYEVSKKTPVVVAPAPKDEPETKEEIEFKNLLSRVQKLEDISKEYNNSNYQVRAMAYIRSGAYNDYQWSILAGPIDETFDSYVSTNQGTNDLTGLKSLQSFTVPKTKDVVDFRHMFAVMNVANGGNSTNSDLAGWGGDLAQLINSFKGSTLVGTELIEEVQEAFNGTSTFGSEDVCADFDAVNIIAKLKADSTKSIASAMQDYYKELTNEVRIKSFREKTFGTSYSSKAELKNIIFTQTTTIGISEFPLINSFFYPIAKDFYFCSVPNS